MIDKDYLKDQTKNPTGHYAEILIRTYYFIMQKCKTKNQGWCYSKEVPYKELKKFAYAKIDHNASLSVVKKAETNLAELGYTKFVKDGEDWTIHIVQPLDFLDEDIEQYVSKSHPIIRKYTHFVKQVVGKLDDSH